MHAERAPLDRPPSSEKRSVYHISKWLVWVAGVIMVALVVLAIALPLTVNKDSSDDNDNRPAAVCPPDEPPQPDSLVQRFDPLLTDPFDELEAEDPSLNVVRLRGLWETLPWEERLGQLSQFIRYDIAGPGFPDYDESHWEDLIGQGKVGSMSNINTLQMANRFQKYAVDKNKVPLIFAYDGDHGYRTIFPVNVGMAAAFDRQLIYEYAQIAAKEMRADGLPWTFAPMLDVARDPRWGRMSEGAGEDPFLAGELGVQYVKGFQENGVATCVKHVAGYGAAQAGRDYFTAELSDATLFNDYLPAYKKALQAGAWSFMASFNTIKNLPSHANRELLTDIVRGLWGFKGVSLSDYGAIGELQSHGVASSMATAANISLTAGMDMSMADGAFMTGLNTFFTQETGFDVVMDDGHTLREYVEQSAKRILVLKERLGLFDENIFPEDDYDSKFLLDEYLKKAQEAAEKGAVLLVNKKGALPIPSTAGKVLLVGMLADNARHQLGSWSAEGRKGSTKEKEVVEKAVTPKEAFEQRITDKTKFVYKQGYTTTTWVEGYEAKDEAAMKEALDAVDETVDYLIYYAGESSDQNGEASSRTNLTLSLNQGTLLRQLEAKLRQKNPKAKLVLVSQTGRPNILSWENDNCDAILQLWAAGHMAGPALIRLLYGEVSPSGKTPVTFPRNVGQIPLGYSDLYSGRPYRPANGIDDGEQYVPPDAMLGITGTPDKFFSRYIDSKISPLYVFGHGLSYTDFAYTAQVTPLSASAGSNDTITIDVIVTNNHPEIAADEIVQVYVKTRISKMAPHKKRLRQFGRVSFNKDDGSKNIQFTLSVQEDFGYFNNGLQWVVEPGTYDIFVAKDSDDEATAFEVTLH